MGMGIYVPKQQKMNKNNTTHPNKKADPTLSAAIILTQPSTTP